MNKPLVLFNGLKIKSLPSVKGLLDREIFVLLLVIGLYDANKGIITKYNVKTCNRANQGTTYNVLKALELKGFITSKKESNHFFAKSYISLTQKGLTFKRELTKLLNTPVG